MNWLLEAVFTMAYAMSWKNQQPLTTGQAKSDPFYPSPWMTPATTGWEDAYVKAKDFVSQLTLLEKVNLTTGVGYILISPQKSRTMLTFYSWEGEQV